MNRLRVWLSAPLAIVIAGAAAHAGAAHAASCDGIEDLDARLACFDRLAECAAIDSDAARLACFEGRLPDTTAGSAPTEPARTDAEDKPADVPATDADAARAPADDGPFGVKGRSRPERDDAAAPTLTASITRVREDPRGIVYLFLDNGQVWRETARSHFRYRPGMSVEISIGTLGSTNLFAEGMRKYAKVRRVE